MNAANGDDADDEKEDVDDVEDVGPSLPKSLWCLGGIESGV